MHHELFLNNDNFNASFFCLNLKAAAICMKRPCDPPCSFWKLFAGAVHSICRKVWILSGQVTFTHGTGCIDTYYTSSLFLQLPGQAVGPALPAPHRLACPSFSPAAGSHRMGLVLSKYVMHSQAGPMLSQGCSLCSWLTFNQAMALALKSRRAQAVSFIFLFLETSTEAFDTSLAFLPLTVCEAAWKMQQ